MSHTPEQARELWCPMVRMRDGSNVDHGDRMMCIADKCAMWRWTDRRSQVFRVRVMCEDRFAEIEPKRPGGLNESFVFIPFDEDSEAHWAEPDEVWKKRRNGYCGLAARPEVMP